MIDAPTIPGNGASALLPADFGRRLRLEQYRLLFLQYRRVTLPAIFVTLGVAYVVSGLVPTGWLLAWAVVNVVMPVIRWWGCRSYLDTTEKIDRHFRQASWLAYTAFLPGIWTGLAAPLFLPWLPTTEQALLTMIIACTVAASLASSAPFPPTFYGYGSVMLLMLAGAWAYSSDDLGLVIAALLVVLLIILIIFVRDNGKMVRDSIRIRFEREPLLQEQRRLIDLLQDASDDADAARRHAEEANRAKSRFLAAASHDLRQPLHAISLLSAVLGEVAHDSTTTRIAEQLSRSVDSLDRLFSAILDLSKLDAGVIVPSRSNVEPSLAYAPLLREYEERARAKRLGWRSAVSDGVAILDFVLVELILRNLLDNAIKYTPAGSVSVEITHAVDALHVTVADTGPGIDEAEREHVFEEFYQIRNPERDRRNGLGLGLAIVKRLVTLLGGAITLTASPSGGACFFVSLPAPAVSEVGEQTIPPAGDYEPIDLGGMAVLVIDDDLEARDAMVLTLRHWRCDAQDARNEVEALAAAKRVPFDFVISDFRLTQGVLGTDVLRAVLANCPGAGGLLITGDIAVAELAAIRESGYPLMHKPVHYRKLKMMLREARR